MIKARLSNGTLILGLSAVNLERLKANEPILFDGRPFGFSGNIGIVYGETEEAITRDLLRASGWFQA